MLNKLGKNLNKTMSLNRTTLLTLQLDNAIISYSDNIENYLRKSLYFGTAASVCIKTNWLMIDNLKRQFEICLNLMTQLRQIFL